MSNHLIIGLGGTGGNILRAFRKTVYQAYSSDAAPGVNLRYLYVDSSDEFMQPDDPSWKILGHSVQLPPAALLYIRGLNLQSIVDNLQQYPTLSPWLGARSDWQDILNSANAANVVGGQKRRLGRFLFATNVDRFRGQVGRFVNELREERSQGVAEASVTFHVCCGLAGGTGSGAIIDVLCQLRSAYPDQANRILVYAQLPERNPSGFRPGENYHANGYAALVELNALAIGTWRPHNISATDGSRVSLQDPFNCCYLFNEENEANVAVSSRDLGEITASFLFQKIVHVPNLNWGNQSSTVKRQETYENSNQGLVPEKSAREAPRRTRQFFSFGIKQIAYPEVEIREYLTYSFAEQAVRQLLFNRWQEGEGFLDEAANQNFAEWVREPATLSRWLLTDDRLTLSEGILQPEIEQAKWKPIASFWSALLPHLVTEVLEEHKKNWVKMMAALTTVADLAYTDQYRSSGVVKFYDTKRRDLGDHVREIRSRVERDLFDSWRIGERSVHDIDRLLLALLESMEERLVALDQKIARFAEESDGYKANEAKIATNRVEWAKLGPIAVTFGKHKSILNAQAEALITRYTMRTRYHGFRFARDLAQRLIQELNVLAAEVTRSKDLLLRAADSFRAAQQARLQDGSGSARDFSGPVIREYDPAEVRRFNRELITDRALQRRQTAAARERLIALLGERLSFTAFVAKIGEVNFKDTLEASSKAEAEAAHSDLIALNPERSRVLHVSLIDTLRREYEGQDETLRNYTRTAINMAKNYLKIDPLQRNLVGPGFNDSQYLCTTSVTIIAPESPESAGFRDRFCTMLRDSVQNADVTTITNPSRPQEITILSITNILPARLVGVVGFLQARYRERRNSANSRRAFIELHSEGESYAISPGQTMYDLYPESYTAADIRPWLQLARAMDLVQQSQDYVTGRKVFQLKLRDRSGLPEPPLDLGPDLDTVIEQASPAIVEELKTQTEALLKTEYLRLEKREQLAEWLYGEVKSTADSLGANAPRYRQELDAYRAVKTILQLENER